MKMNAMTTKQIIAGLLFLFTLVSGVWLSHSGKPLNVAMITIHKLIALATVIAIAVNVYPLYRAADIRTFLEPVLIAVSGLAFLALFISGALLSLAKPLPGAVLGIHQVAPLLALAFSAMALYMLVSSQS
jgi:hypothetical protein